MTDEDPRLTELRRYNRRWNAIYTAWLWILGAAVTVGVTLLVVYREWLIWFR